MDFKIIDGTEKYRVIDLATNGESFADDKKEAYKMAAVIVYKLGHTAKIESRDTKGKLEWSATNGPK